LEAIFPILVGLDMGDPATRMKIRTALVMLIAFILSVAVHEFGHAIMADKLGDSTPRSQGRVSLNPMVHADPIGTIALPLFGAFMGFVIGWGKPVMVNPLAFTRKLRMKVAHLIVALAGPMMNVFLAIFVTGLLTVLVATGVLTAKDEIVMGIFQVIYINWLLFFFNLLPIPPLDGGAVLAGLLPDRAQPFLAQLNQYGFIILIALFASNALRYLLYPAQVLAVWCMRLAFSIAT
jgi:Zn-dependent protease